MHLNIVISLVNFTVSSIKPFDWEGMNCVMGSANHLFSTVIYIMIAIFGRVALVQTRVITYGECWAAGKKLS
jgi:hypothetical protein